MSTINADPPSSKGPKIPGNCNNKIGKNQYKDRPAPDDPRVTELLKEYHSKGITDRSKVSKLLGEHGITLSEASISRRKRKLGLKASHLTTLELSVPVKRKLILDQMAKDPKGRLGARMVKQGILQDTGIHLTRDYIREEMKHLDPDGYAARGPTHVKVKRQQKQQQQLATPDGSLSIGPSEEHSNPSSLHCSTQTIPLDLASGFVPSLQPHPIPLLPVVHSETMEVEEDSDSSDVDPSFNLSHAEIPNLLPSQNAHPAHEPGPHLFLDTHSPEPSHSLSMTAVLGILRDIVPRMSALTRILDGLNVDKEVFDAQAHNLVTGGMEAAALLERQLARAASKTQCYRP